MDSKTFINRVLIAQNLERSRRNSPNPALVAKYQGYNSASNLIELTGTDGGVYFQSKITNQKFTEGRAVTASVKTGRLGFSDGRSL